MVLTGAQPGDGTEIKVHIANMKRIASYHGIAMFVDWHSYGQLFMSRKYLPYHNH